MAPIRRVVKRARAAAEKASAVHTISAAERAQHAALPPLVRQGPRWLTVAACRPANPRTARLTAQHYLLAVKDMFDILPLEAKQGDITKPTETYGGLGASFSYNHGVAPPTQHTKMGSLFRGVPACKKGHQSNEHIAKNMKAWTPLLIALMLSLSDTLYSGYWSRFSANCGHTTGWHVDNNTRGAQPAAMLVLDPGGGLLLCKSISFRCSLIWLDGCLVVPWALDCIHFRYMEWDQDGVATIEQVEAAVFWKLAHQQSVTHCHLTTCLLEITNGIALGSILYNEADPPQLPEHASMLTPYTFAELCAMASVSTHATAQPMFEAIGLDQKWSIFFGWRFAHCWIGSPWCRRYHLFGCPLRNVPTGQVRRVEREYQFSEAHFEPRALRNGRGLVPYPPRPKVERHTPPPPPPAEDQEELSEYEMERLANIARNHGILEELGLA